MAEEMPSPAANAETPSRAQAAEAAWAKPVDRVRLDSTGGGLRANVDGRPIVGPLQGFGQMWQKTYRVRLSGASAKPSDVIRTWRESFGEFWPAHNHFYGKLGSLSPGDVALLNLGVMPGMGGVVLSTGVMVIYADDESFAFMTPRGHMYAAMITFSAYEEDGATVAQVQPLLRANDPFIEIMCRLGYGHWIEDIHWRHTLKALAAHFGVAEAPVEQRNILVDSHLQWSEARNVVYNPALQTGLYVVGTPFRWLSRLVGRRAGH